MDTKKINALLTAVDRGSLTAAAAELGYTQSGLTHMMNALEEELGLNLLVRSKGGVHLSPAGQALLPRMRALMDAADQLDAQAQQLRQRNFSTLRLGAYTSTARQWLPAILAAFRRQSPDTEVELYVGGVPDIYEMLKNDQLDCAIVSFHEELAQGLHFTPLRDDALVAVLPAGYPLEGDSFPVEAFAGKEFLMRFHHLMHQRNDIVRIYIGVCVNRSVPHGLLSLKIVYEVSKIQVAIVQSVYLFKLFSILPSVPAPRIYKISIEVQRDTVWLVVVFFNAHFKVFLPLG